MKNQTAEEWKAVKGILAGIVGRADGSSPAFFNGIVTDTFTTGMLMGNADIGVVAGGTPDEQRFYFAKSDLWGSLVKYPEKDDVWQEGILSFGGLTISACRPAPPDAGCFQMEQDILHAEVNSRMRLGGAVVSMDSWVSDGENLFVAAVSNHSDRDAELCLNLWVPTTYRIKGETRDCRQVYPYACGCENGTMWTERESRSFNNGSKATDPGAPPTTLDILWMTRGNYRHPDSIPVPYPSDSYRAKVWAALKLLGAEFTEKKSGKGSVGGSFVLSPGAGAWIVVCFESVHAAGEIGKKEETDCRQRAIADAAALSLSQIRQLKRKHRNWWKQFWLRSWLNVGDHTLEAYYYGSLYVLGCTHRKGRFSPSLWGEWVTTDVAKWGGRYFLNYNAEAPLYGVCSANHPECVLPYAEALLAAQDMQRNRTAAAGYKGISYQRTLTLYDRFRSALTPLPIAKEKDCRKLPADQKSNASFAVMPLIWYYEYTRDDGFLREKLYPFVKELVDFWLDFVVRVDLGGGKYRYDVRHTSVHEATGNDVNASLDLGFIRRLTAFLLDTSQRLNADESMRPAWHDLHEHIAPFKTGIYDGAECYESAYCLDPDQPHNQYIEPGDQPVELEGIVFPGENVSHGGNEHELTTARNTLAYMAPWCVQPFGRFNSAANGFPKTFPIAARADWNADDLLAKFKDAIRYQWRESNLTVFEAGGGIETVGSIETIHSMLLQHENGVMTVFPNWPLGKDAQFHRLRAKGAFLVSAGLAERQVTTVQILSERGGPLRLKNPWVSKIPAVMRVDRKGSAVSVPFTLQDHVIAWKTTRGATYRVVEKAD